MLDCVETTPPPVQTSTAVLIKRFGAAVLDEDFHLAIGISGIRRKNPVGRDRGIVDARVFRQFSTRPMSGMPAPSWASCTRRTAVVQIGGQQFPGLRWR